MVEKYLNRDRENGINFFDFQPSKVKPLLVGSSLRDICECDFITDNLRPNSFGWSSFFIRMLL